MPVCTDLKEYVSTIDKRRAFSRFFSLTTLALTQGLLFVPHAHFMEPDGCSDTPIEDDNY